MSRNLGRPESRDDDRYSRTNPPPDEETALEVMEELAADVASIEASLDHADPHAFPTDDDYQSWRRRATGALGHVRTELAFLERWVQNRRQPSQGGLAAVAESIRSRARDLAREISGSHSPRYSATLPPESVEAAHERMSYLTGMKQQLQAAFGEIAAAWTSHPLRREDMSGAKAPLQKLLSNVETEIGVVKCYIRSHAARNADWKAVCLAALTRAVAEGFVLTPAEQAALEQPRRRGLND